MLQRPPSAQLAAVDYPALDMQAEDNDPVPKFHPLFDSSEADVVLGSHDGVLFRVHSYTLKTTSGWFKSMFSLPQKEEEDKKPDAATFQVTLYLDEDSAVLESLFRCICGLPIPLLDSYDIIEPFLYAAEKYDMPGPLSIIRALIMTPPMLEDPLRLFVMACRYGWVDIAQLAATKTLTLNIFDASLRTTLKKLTTPSLLNLIDLHRARRDLLKQRLNEAPFVSDGPSSCSHCGSPVDYHTWRELKHAMIMEMDVRPLGDTICEVNLADWPQARSCWEAKCSTCSRVLYDRKETLIAIRNSIDGLQLSQ
ncbi:hypothetical protein BDY19DRAFT_922717 [Irpex rosettiformis]|uniref:Uncharacterized protein n=1 Tax=Irpex rosettiformis TaxID=378272 RepID=A0ACB8UFM5_9APHY|nr:hypothetical protein BDY19DRAFT_922717 [Irpex rosettiformis]